MALEKVRVRLPSSSVWSGCAVSHNHLVVLYLQFLYVLPLPWRRLSIMCYRNALIASLFNYAYLIYNSHGRPRMSQEVSTSGLTIRFIDK